MSRKRPCSSSCSQISFFYQDCFHSISCLHVFVPHLFYSSKIIPP
uniref:Uncharacterized protein n=1 Tax=Myoviridae sp. ct1ba2 TaxID=2827654 RepID=A0A8S5S6J2_9CAUD|nr:MAG TPA: hypothetical protein [Myoviridae sp. ct1ba2]